MRERAPVWAARVVLLAPLVAALVWLFPFIRDFILLPANHTYLWPFGLCSYVFEQVPIYTAYVVVGLIGCAAAFYAGVQVWFVLQTVWWVAWRRPHVRLTRRWATWCDEKAWQDERYSNRYVVYSKPQPLIRGRIGSR